MQRNTPRTFSQRVNNGDQKIQRKNKTKKLVVWSADAGVEVVTMVVEAVDALVAELAVQAVLEHMAIAEPAEAVFHQRLRRR